jgi:hypothetical protein
LNVAGIANRLNDQAVGRLTGDNRRATFTALQNASATIQSQPALDLLRSLSVALVAALGKKRPNLSLKEGYAGSILVANHRRRPQPEHQEYQAHSHWAAR